MPGSMCPFHTDEWSLGQRLPDGSHAHSCTRTAGHPGGTAWQWLEAPAPPAGTEVSGLAAELGLDVELPAALASLGEGWFEYGLVERAYATRRPDDFALLIERWGHTVMTPKQYTASAYLARTLGDLSRRGSVAYHPGRGTGRWSYNTDISWWSTPPPPPWDEQHRRSWAAELGQGDAACLAYVVPA